LIGLSPLLQQFFQRTARVQYVITQQLAGSRHIAFESKVFTIKWRIRVFAWIGGLFWIALILWSSRDLRTGAGVALIIMAIIFIAMGVSLGSGVVITNPLGISKKAFWSTRFLKWKEIAEVRLHKRQGTAIELCSSEDL
jgi:hypothetical protein